MSYRRDKEYQNNHHTYKTEQIIAAMVLMFIVSFFTKYGWIVFLLLATYVSVKVWNKLSGPSTNKNNDVVKEITIESLNKEEMKDMKTTDKGYLNKNNQRNNGRTGRPGTDYGQWFYEMECMNCGHKYNANGTDIWQRKCPKCQGGRP